MEAIITLIKEYLDASYDGNRDIVTATILAFVDVLGQDLAAEFEPDDIEAVAYSWAGEAILASPAVDDDDLRVQPEEGQAR